MTAAVESLSSSLISSFDQANGGFKPNQIKSELQLRIIFCGFFSDYYLFDLFDFPQMDTVHRNLYQKERMYIAHCTPPKGCTVIVIILSRSQLNRNAISSARRYKITTNFAHFSRRESHELLFCSRQYQRLSWHFFERLFRQSKKTLSVCVFPLRSYVQYERLIRIP